MTSTDLHLKTISPAADAGNDGVIQDFLSDPGGETRVVDGDLDDTPTVDMGAYEYQIEYA